MVRESGSRPVGQRPAVPITFLLSRLSYHEFPGKARGFCICQKAKWYTLRSVDGFLDQTYKRFELLPVDDGSTDSYGAICDEYAVDPRVRVCRIPADDGPIAGAEV